MKAEDTARGLMAALAAKPTPVRPSLRPLDDGDVEVLVRAATAVGNLVNQDAATARGWAQWVPDALRQVADRVEREAAALRGVAALEVDQ